MPGTAEHGIGKVERLRRGGLTEIAGLAAAPLPAALFAAAGCCTPRNWRPGIETKGSQTLLTRKTENADLEQLREKVPYSLALMQARFCRHFIHRDNDLSTDHLLDRPGA